MQPNRREARGQVRPGLCEVRRLDRVASGCHVQVCGRGRMVTWPQHLTGRGLGEPQS